MIVYKKNHQIMEITPPRTVIKFHSKQKQSVISQKYKKYTGILCAFLHLYSLSGIYYIHTQNNGHFFISFYSYINTTKKYQSRYFRLP